MEVWQGLTEQLKETYGLLHVLKKTDTKELLVLKHKTTGKLVLLRNYPGEILDIYRVLLGRKLPHIPQILDLRRKEGGFYVLEEFAEGQPPKPGTYTHAQVRAMLRQLCDALSAIHALGIVHRDLKPDNLLVSEDGSLWLLDFDAARIYKAHAVQDTCILGTTGFAAPEQFGIVQTDQRADIFALGITLNALLTGFHPTEQLCKGPFRRIVMKCTQIDPKKRYQTARSVWLAASLTKPLLMTAGLSAAATVLALGIFLTRAPQAAEPPPMQEVQLELPPEEPSAPETEHQQTAKPVTHRDPPDKQTPPEPHAPQEEPAAKPDPKAEQQTKPKSEAEPEVKPEAETEPSDPDTQPEYGEPAPPVSPVEPPPPPVEPEPPTDPDPVPPTEPEPETPVEPETPPPVFDEDVPQELIDAQARFSEASEKLNVAGDALTACEQKPFYQKYKALLHENLALHNTYCQYDADATAVQERLTVLRAADPPDEAAIAAAQAEYDLLSQKSQEAWDRYSAQGEEFQAYMNTAEFKKGSAEHNRLVEEYNILQEEYEAALHHYQQVEKEYLESKNQAGAG